MSTRHTGSRFAQHLEKNCKFANREGSKMLSIRLDSIDSRRFVCLDVDPSYWKSICAALRRKTASCLTGQGRKCCRFDSIRSIRDDSSALMSTRHTGSRFARYLEKNCNLVNREGSKMLSIRLDSIDSRRFVCLDVDPSYWKSIFAALRRKTASCLTGQGRKCCRFDSIRSIRDDSSALMSTRHTGSRFARYLEKNCNLVNREGSKMLSIRLDSIDSRRFVCLDVDPSYRKSICATLREKLQVG